MAYLTGRGGGAYRYIPPVRYRPHIYVASHRGVYDTAGCQFKTEKCQFKTEKCVQGGGSSKVDRLIEKKRKRNATKVHKHVPYRREVRPLPPPLALTLWCGDRVKSAHLSVCAHSALASICCTEIPRSWQPR